MSSPPPLDPYAHWLGIPPHDQPPDYYQLLGLTNNEANTEAITLAASERVTTLEEHLATGNRQEVQRLINEVTLARDFLLEPVQKLGYDAGLQSARAQGSRREANLTSSTTPLRRGVTRRLVLLLVALLLVSLAYLSQRSPWRFSSYGEKETLVADEVPPGRAAKLWKWATHRGQHSAFVPSADGRLFATFSYNQDPVAFEIRQTSTGLSRSHTFAYTVRGPQNEGGLALHLDGSVLSAAGCADEPHQVFAFLRNLALQSSLTTPGPVQLALSPDAKLLACGSSGSCDDIAINTSRGGTIHTVVCSRKNVDVVRLFTSADTLIALYRDEQNPDACFHVLALRWSDRETLAEFTVPQRMIVRGAAHAGDDLWLWGSTPDRGPSLVRWNLIAQRLIKAPTVLGDVSTIVEDLVTNGEGAIKLVLLDTAQPAVELQQLALNRQGKFQRARLLYPTVGQQVRFFERGEQLVCLPASIEHPLMNWNVSAVLAHGDIVPPPASEFYLPPPLGILRNGESGELEASAR